jgi:hypothetical protein
LRHGSTVEAELVEAVARAGNVHQVLGRVVRIDRDAPIFPELDRARRGMPDVALIEKNEMNTGAPVGFIELAALHADHDRDVDTVDDRLVLAERLHECRHRHARSRR